MRATFSIRASVPQFQRNDFGAALGGPIRKDKTFLFGNYEGYRQHLGVSDVTLVPNTQARLGYLPDSNGKLKYVGVAPGVQPLLCAVAGCRMVRTWEAALRKHSAIHCRPFARISGRRGWTIPSQIVTRCLPSTLLTTAPTIRLLRIL